jgi:pimeloyl-ACP methyl ester carboxylesterase
LGLWLAATDQSLFKKVIALDALPCMGAVMMPNYDASTIVYESPYSNQMLQQDTDSFHKLVQQQVGFMMLNKDKRARVVDMMLQADRKTYVYGYIDLLKLDLRNDIAGIQIPVVVLAATHPNKAIIEKTYNEQFAKLGNKVIHYADKAAHFVMYDQPEWYISKIKENIQ